MSNKSLVSIIMAVYNGEPYIEEAIESVLAQSYKHWQLHIINDGSTDNTKTIINKFNDSRIIYHEQSNAGVSAARNVGLSAMQGEFFCFLDADDIFTVNSLAIRVEMLRNMPSLQFADGTVIIKDAELAKNLAIRTMKHSGPVFKTLIRNPEACFFGPSWMVRRQAGIHYEFDTLMTHAEDISFYLSISQQGDYAASKQVILHYRQGNDSAMSNYEGLENGYARLYEHIKEHPMASWQDEFYSKYRFSRIMILSYLRQLQFMSAFKVLLRFSRL